VIESELESYAAEDRQASPRQTIEGPLNRMLPRLAANWSSLPTYATRSLAPLALIWFSPLRICIVLLVCSFLWHPIRSRFVSLRLALLLSALNNILVCIAANLIVALAFILAGAFVDGLIALLWPVVAATLSHVCPQNRTSQVHEKLWRQLTNRPHVPAVAVALSEQLPVI